MVGLRFCQYLCTNVSYMSHLLKRATTVCFNFKKSVTKFAIAESVAWTPEIQQRIQIDLGYSFNVDSKWKN